MNIRQCGPTPDIQPRKRRPTMNIEGGIFPVLKQDYKEAGGPSGRISAAENRRILAKGMRAIKEEFEGATSERGLAAQRKALVKTHAQATEEYTFGKKAQKVSHGFLGPELDGKGNCSMAIVEK